MKIVRNLTVRPLLPIAVLHLLHLLVSSCYALPGWDLKRISGFDDPSVPEGELEAWADEYVAACDAAASSDSSAFRTFKQMPGIQRITEHDGTAEHARQWSMMILEHQPSWSLEERPALYRAAEVADRTGSPRVRHPVSSELSVTGVGRLSRRPGEGGGRRGQQSSRGKAGDNNAPSSSPTTTPLLLSAAILRYLAQAAEVGSRFRIPQRRPPYLSTGSATSAGPPPPDGKGWAVAEVGGSFGGLAHVMTEAYHIESYKVFDLEPVRRLGRVYLDTVGTRVPVTFHDLAALEEEIERREKEGAGGGGGGGGGDNRSTGGAASTTTATSATATDRGDAGTEISVDAMGSATTTSVLLQQYEFDLVISNFALSELTDELQASYARRVFTRARRLFLSLNSDCPALLSALRQDKHGWVLSAEDEARIMWAGQIRKGSGLSPVVALSRGRLTE